MSSTLVHLAGPCIRFRTLQRQRCSWCGFVIVDDDLSMMAFPLNADGSVPEPAQGFPFDQLVEITTDGGFRSSALVEIEPEEDGSVIVPDNCCMLLPRELTGEKT